MTRRPIASPTGRRVILDPVHANIGLAAAFRRKLMAEITAMHDSLVYWITASYRRHVPEMSPAPAP